MAGWAGCVIADLAVVATDARATVGFHTRGATITLVIGGARGAWLLRAGCNTLGVVARAIFIRVARERAWAARVSDGVTCKSAK